MTLLFLTFNAGCLLHKSEIRDWVRFVILEIVPELRNVCCPSWANRQITSYIRLISRRSLTVLIARKTNPVQPPTNADARSFSVLRWPIAIVNGISECIGKGRVINSYSQPLARLFSRLFLGRGLVHLPHPINRHSRQACAQDLGFDQCSVRQQPVYHSLKSPVCSCVWTTLPA